ncbi:MAG TPA: hypothetical protein VIH98_03215 [Xanthobacteraceae bacterium]|jgi:hypothetical protein
MDRAALEQRLRQIEAKIAAVQQQIREQHQVIAKLEGAGRPADHAKYLLAGLELLHTAYRTSRKAMLAQFMDACE